MYDSALANFDRVADVSANFGSLVRELAEETTSQRSEIKSNILVN